LEADRDNQDLNAAIILLRNRKDVFLAEPVMH
jgi:hypothetical protein